MSMRRPISAVVALILYTAHTAAPTEGWAHQRHFPKSLDGVDNNARRSLLIAFGGAPFLTRTIPCARAEEDDPLAAFGEQLQQQQGLPSSSSFLGSSNNSTDFSKALQDAASKKTVEPRTHG